MKTFCSLIIFPLGFFLTLFQLPWSLIPLPLYPLLLQFPLHFPLSEKSTSRNYAKLIKSAIFFTLDWYFCWCCCPRVLNRGSSVFGMATFTWVLHFWLQFSFGFVFSCCSISWFVSLHLISFRPWFTVGLLSCTGHRSTPLCSFKGSETFWLSSCGS